ncbi:hypothetical protein [Arthrobacter oryzae]|uniref:ATP-dependent DNA ligase n=1 Tax=Arthrobacter oryzae TaxID=409290 RepID=UPI0037C0A96C
MKVALARVVTKMPRTTTQTGNLSYEPKWDGYRCICIRDDNGAILWSRQGKDLTRYSVGVKRRRTDLCPGETPVISARQCRSLDSRSQTVESA